MKVPTAVVESTDESGICCSASQVGRVSEIKQLEVITPVIVEAARKTLVFVAPIAPSKSTTTCQIERPFAAPARRRRPVGAGRTRSSSA